MVAIRAREFSNHHSLILLFGALPLILLIVGTIVYHVQAERQAQLDQLSIAFLEHRSVLDAVIGSAQRAWGDHSAAAFDRSLLPFLDKVLEAFAQPLRGSWLVSEDGQPLAHPGRPTTGEDRPGNADQLPPEFATLGDGSLLDAPGEPRKLADILRSEGHEVAIASSGQQALGQLAGRAFDLILCDVHMPDLDGPALYRGLGEIRPELQRHVVFFTGDLLSGTVEQFLKETGRPCLDKPFRPIDLRRAIASVTLDPPVRGAPPTASVL
jgi:CheY-like chemotaxis protein